MKKITIILFATTLLSCKKNLETQPLRPQEVMLKTTQIIVPKAYDMHVKTAVMIGTTQKVTFDNTPVTIYITPDKTDKIKSAVVYSLGTKSFGATMYLSTTAGITSFKLVSLKGVEYYRFLTNQYNQVGGFYVTSDLPIEILFPHITVIQQRTYGQCMKGYFNECSKGWGCSLMCLTTLAGLGGCSFGWTTACLQGIQAT